MRVAKGTSLRCVVVVVERCRGVYPHNIHAQIPQSRTLVEHCGRVVVVVLSSSSSVVVKRILTTFTPSWV